LTPRWGQYGETQKGTNWILVSKMAKKEKENEGKGKINAMTFMGCPSYKLEVLEVGGQRIQKKNGDSIKQDTSAGEFWGVKS